MEHVENWRVKIMSWVLPDILTVEDVNNLPEEVLVELTKISTGIILEYVNNFIAGNINSDNPENVAAATKLQTVYATLNKTNEYLKSQEAKDFASTLANLQYSDIRYDVELEVLKQWRSQIIDLLAEDDDFKDSYTGDVGDSETRGMKTAYTTKLDKDNLDNTLARMTGLGIATGSFVVTERLIAKIIEYSGLFRNGNYNLNNPTVMRRAIWKKDRLTTILKGLDYIIPRKEAGMNASEWRKL